MALANRGKAVHRQLYLVDHLQPDFAGVVEAQPVEQSVGLSTGKAAQQNGLSEAAGLAGQIPLPHAHDVNSMLSLGNLIQGL